jgi:thiol-disulfide isomerase/thioredoxin
MTPLAHCNAPDMFHYEHPAVATVRHDCAAPSNRTIITVGVVCAVMAYLYKMNAAAASKMPQAARVVSAMVSRIVSGRVVGTSARKSNTTEGNDSSPSEAPKAKISSDVRDISEAEAKRDVDDCKKPVLLFIWAHWCGHCHEAMAHLGKAAAKLKKETDIETKAVNGATCSQEFLESLNISGFPTFLMIWPGGTTHQCRNHPAQLEAFCKECQSDPSKSFSMYY